MAELRDPNSGDVYNDETHQTATKEQWNHPDFTWEMVDGEMLEVENVRSVNPRGRPAERAAHLKEAVYQRMLSRRGPAAAQRADEAAGMSAWNPFADDGPTQATLLAGREVDKLVAGTKDLGHFIGSEFDRATGDREGEMAHYAAANELRNVQEDEDRISRELEEEAFTAHLAKGAPYMVSGFGAGPAVNKVSGKAIDAIIDTTKAVGTQTRSGTQRAVDAIAGMNGIPGQIGRKAEREIMAPLAKRSAQRKARPSRPDPFREGAVSDIAGGTVLGGVEGGLHCDEDILFGAGSGGFGAFTGRVLKPHLSQSPEYWTENQGRIIDWAADQGYTLTPGMRTGSRAMQKFESELRKSGDTADFMGQVDSANAMVMNRKAAEAAGFSEHVTEFSPDNLNRHMADLREQYTRLESMSVGRFDGSDMATIGQGIADLKKIGSKPAIKAAEAMTAHLKRIQNMSRPTRHPKTNRFQKATFDGKQYQKMRQEVKTAMDGYYKNNEFEAASGLKLIVHALDEAMDRGVKDFGGKAHASNWRELNEKYAMTKLLLNKGITEDGQLNARKLGNHLMENDSERMLLEKGGRIQDFFKLAKVDYMSRNTAESGFASGALKDMQNNGRMGPVQALITSPANHVIPLLDRIYLNMYASGYPSTSGLLGLTGKNAGDVTTWARAIEQGLDSHTGPTKKVAETVEDIQTWYDQMQEDHKNR